MSEKGTTMNAEEFAEAIRLLESTPVIKPFDTPDGPMYRFEKDKGGRWIPVSVAEEAGD